MPTAIRSFVRSFGLDAYVVGGAVRDELLGIPHADEDFLVVGVDQATLSGALARFGRVEEMEVHGQLVGVRLHPGDAELRRLVPAGIELTPPRVERSTGPGHRDFEIVVDSSAGVSDDMARRDFTVNAIARSLRSGELIDPFGGLSDLARRELRVVSPNSFSEDPLRILRGLRLVSQLGFEIDGDTLARMRLEVGALHHVSGERIGGGLAPGGMGELSKLLLGRRPERALVLARDIGALSVVIPEFAPSIGYGLASERQPLPLDGHVLEVVRLAAAANASLEVRLAALLHDLGKPIADETRASHAAIAAEIADRALRRLRYPTALRRRVVDIVRRHAFHLDPWLDPPDGGVATRRFLRAHGRSLARELVAHKRADLGAKLVAPKEITALDRLERELDEQRSSPHRISDLAVTGDDLKAIGHVEGPELGNILSTLLDLVVDDPARNVREHLLEHAQTLS